VVGLQTSSSPASSSSAVPTSASTPIGEAQASSEAAVDRAQGEAKASSVAIAERARGSATAKEARQGPVKNRMPPLKGSVRLSQNPAPPVEQQLPAALVRDAASLGRDATDERPPKRQRLQEEHVGAELECARLHVCHAALQAKQDRLKEQLAKVATARRQAASVARQRREEESEAWAKLRHSVAAGSCSDLHNALQALTATAATLARSQASNGIMTPHG